MKYLNKSFSVSMSCKDDWHSRIFNKGEDVTDDTQEPINEVQDVVVEKQKFDMHVFRINGEFNITVEAVNLDEARTLAQRYATHKLIDFHKSKNRYIVLDFTKKPVEDVPLEKLGVPDEFTEDTQ